MFSMLAMVFALTGCGGDFVKNGLVKLDRGTFSSATSRGKVAGKAIYSAWMVAQQTNPEIAKDAENLYLQLTASPDGNYDLGVLNTTAVALLKEAIAKKQDPATAALAAAALISIGHMTDDLAANRLESGTAGEFVQGVITGIEEAKSSHKLEAIAALVKQYQELKKEQDALKAAEKLEKEKQKEAAAQAAGTTTETQPDVPPEATAAKEKFVYTPFVCTHSECTFKNLGKDASLDFQTALAMQLADYVVHEARKEAFTPTIEENVQEFLLRMSELDAKGYAETWLVIDSITVKKTGRGNKDGYELVAIVFLLRQEDGSYIPENCVSCAPTEYEDFYAEKGLVKMKPVDEDNE